MDLKKINAVLSMLWVVSLILGHLLVGDAMKPQAFTQELEAALPDLMAEYNVPGVSVALLEDGEVVYLESFGFADQAQQQPMTVDTFHQVASVSKSLAAWGVLKLVDDGLIDLDDPVEKYLTRWHIPPSEYDVQGVTVRRLLDHTAGISLDGYGRGLEVDEPLPSLEASLNGDTRGAGRVELIREPGLAFMYSGGGYTILQLMIEEVTGQTFNEYMESAVLRPLGMVESTFIWNPTLQTRLGSAYGGYNNLIPNYRYIEDAAGGLYSTPREMAQYAQVLVNGSSVLSDESFALLFDGETYGLGHAVMDFPSGEHLIFGGGTRMGWQSDFVVIPADGSGIVVLSNANGGVILNLAVINLWTRWKTGTSWPGAGLFLYQRPVLIAVAAILGGVCLLWAIRLYRQFRRGQRRSSFRTAWGRKWLRLVLVLAVFGGLIYLWLAALTPWIDAQQQLLWLPEPALYAGLALTGLGILSCVSLLFPREREARA